MDVYNKIQENYLPNGGIITFYALTKNGNVRIKTCFGGELIGTATFSKGKLQNSKGKIFEVDTDPKSIASPFNGVSHIFIVFYLCYGSIAGWDTYDIGFDGSASMECCNLGTMA